MFLQKGYRERSARLIASHRNAFDDQIIGLTKLSDQLGKPVHGKPSSDRYEFVVTSETCALLSLGTRTKIDTVWACHKDASKLIDLFEAKIKILDAGEINHGGGWIRDFCCDNEFYDAAIKKGVIVYASRNLVLYAGEFTDEDIL